MNVLMPQLGETVTEGTVSAWFKAVGDEVAEGEALFEIETDKVTMEVTATQSGVLSEIRVARGATVPVGAVVAVIGDGAAAEEAPGAAPAPSGNGAAPLDPFREVRTPERNFGRAEGPGGVKVTPLARRLIATEGLDLEALAREIRSRGAWRIGKREVEAALKARPAEARAPATPLEPRPDEEAFELNAIQRAAGRQLARSWQQIPHVFQAVEVDFFRVDKLRAERRAAFRQTYGVSLTYLPFIARAAVLAIHDFPKINARYDDNRLLISRRVHLGIAVDLAHQGLVVPTIFNADELNVAGFAGAIHRLVGKARAGGLTPEDFSGATYTVSNNGSFGTLFTAPIINAPQVAILSTDAVRKRPVVVETDAGDAILPRPVGILAQSFDHRAFDGAYSAAYLQRLKEILETRDWAAEAA